MPFNLKNFIPAFIFKSNLKETSRKTYTSKLLNFAKWLRQNHIQFPTEIDLHTFHEYLQKNKRLSITSSNGYVTAMKAFFAWLNTENKYPDIALSLKGKHNLPGSKKESLNNQQIKQLLKSINRNSLDGKRDYALINFIIGTGLRSIEIPEIIRGDIANCCALRVLWIKTKNSSGKNKDIILSDHVFNSIMAYLEARTSTNDADPLFASHSKKNFGQRMTPRSITRIIRTRLDSAHIDTGKICPASLRSTALRLASRRSKNKKLTN